MKALCWLPMRERPSGGGTAGHDDHRSRRRGAARRRHLGAHDALGHQGRGLAHLRARRALRDPPGRERQGAAAGAAPALRGVLRRGRGDRRRLVEGAASRPLPVRRHLRSPGGSRHRSTVERQPGQDAAGRYLSAAAPRRGRAPPRILLAGRVRSRAAARTSSGHALPRARPLLRPRGTTVPSGSSSCCGAGCGSMPATTPWTC